MSIEEVINNLPYKSSFKFVDNIISINDNSVEGEYTLKENAFFYEDHFVNKPVTPGVIITEIMAQIGIVSLGIYLVLTKADSNIQQTGTLFPLLTSTDVSFFKLVLPGEKVKVISKKEYFRFGKLKCYIEMYTPANELIARGTFSGIIKNFDIQ